MKKEILTLAAALVFALPFTAGAADFIHLDEASFDTMWQKGKTIKKHGSLENPMHYGVEMRHGTIGSNQVVLVTPYTAGLYISSTETKGSGRAEHLALVKEGKMIFPRYTMDPVVDELMPHSHFVRYFGFTRKEILDVPYEVRYVNGEGDLISFKVNEKDLETLIREEKNFKA